MEKARRIVGIIIICLFAIFITVILLQAFDLVSTRILNTIVAMTVVPGIPLCFLVKRLHHKIEAKEKAKQEQKAEPH